MNFLREFDISDKTIERIKENNDDSILNNLIFDSENVRKIIEFFREIDIEVIDDLLIYRPEIFSIDYKKLVDEFNKYNLKILVSLINDDISAINFI